jgi:DNA-binding MarR family transcriptional regulator
MADKLQQLDAAMYRDNLFRDILGVARAYQADVMRLLAQHKGHHQLRLSFQPVITGLPEDGMRVTELASQLGMSKQNCFQLLKQIERAGYIERLGDSSDKRARKICLTPRGQQLLDDGAAVIASIDASYRDQIGDLAFSKIEPLLWRLCRGLDLPSSHYQYRSSAGDASSVSIGLIQLAQHCTRALMELTIERGHNGLRLSYGQVLMHIGTDGARMQDIARINHVSKQAIGQIVSELELLGYIKRAANPADGRSKLLYFTEAGLSLISDSVAAARQLEKTYADAVGTSELAALQRSLHLLNTSLPLAQAIGNPDTPPPGSTISHVDIVLYLLGELEHQPVAQSMLLQPIANSGGSGEVQLSQQGLDTIAQGSANANTVQRQLQTLLGSEKLAQLNGLLKELAHGIEN